MVLSIVKAQDYIDQVRWQYAKTMPDWPHEYTIKSWRPDLAREFESLCQLILNEGVVAPWPPPPAPAIYHNNYLVVGDWKYWAMGPRGDSDAVTDKTVINREYCGPETVRPSPKRSGQMSCTQQETPRAVAWKSTTSTLLGETASWRSTACTVRVPPLVGRADV